MVPVPSALYAKIAQKAEYDGVPVYTVMETALQKFVAPAADSQAMPARIITSVNP
jgi:hypothetical protein